MTRSTAKRMSAGARYVAMAASPPPSFIIATWWRAYPTGDAQAAQNFTNRYLAQMNGFDADRLSEVNWSYTAELMNGMTR